MRQEVTKCDKEIDELKVKMQQMQKQHGMFKEQFDKLRHSLRRPTEEPSKSREFKL